MKAFILALVLFWAADLDCSLITYADVEPEPEPGPVVVCEWGVVVVSDWGSQHRITRERPGVGPIK